MAELKSSTMTNGEQFAMMIGTSMTLTWFADSLALQGWLPMPTLAPFLAKGLDLFGWMTWRVQVANHISTIADNMDGAPMIALTAKTRACVVYMAHLTFVWSVVVVEPRYEIRQQTFKNIYYISHTVTLHTHLNKLP